MALPGREQIRSAVLRYIELPGAKFFRAIKFTPNGITILGFLITVVSAYLVGAGWLLTGSVSPFGAMLDSVFDRLSEAALFVGIAIFALRDDMSEDRQIFFITVLLLALIFSQVVSYLRARGEGLGVFTKGGIMTRPERVVLLGVGLIVGQIEWFLLVIALVSCFTLFQRMFTIRDLLDKGG